MHIMLFKYNSIRMIISIVEIVVFHFKFHRKLPRQFGAISFARSFGKECNNALAIGIATTCEKNNESA